MRLLDRKQLIEYLPDVIGEFKEIKQIMKSEQVQADKLWSTIYNILDNAFISTEDKKGASRWESILNIKPLDRDTVQLRNYRIKARLLEDIPYTWRIFNRMLTSLRGEGGYKIMMDKDKLILTIKVALTSKRFKNEVSTMADRVVPLNIILDIDLLYNTHRIIKDMNLTNGQLIEFSHLSLREEPF